MKTLEHVKLMKKVLINEINQLPEENIFGEDNNSDRELLQSWIIDLAYIEKFGSVNDKNSEVSFWYHDECWSPLYDYEGALAEFTEYEQLLRYAAWLNM
jgi:hypothetical protein